MYYLGGSEDHKSDNTTRKTLFPLPMNPLALFFSSLRHAVGETKRRKGIPITFKKAPESKDHSIKHLSIFVAKLEELFWGSVRVLGGNSDGLNCVTSRGLTSRNKRLEYVRELEDTAVMHSYHESASTYCLECVRMCQLETVKIRHTPLSRTWPHVAWRSATSAMAHIVRIPSLPHQRVLVFLINNYSE